MVHKKMKGGADNNKGIFASISGVVVLIAFLIASVMFMFMMIWAVTKINSDNDMKSLYDNIYNPILESTPIPLTSLTSYFDE